VVAQQTNGKAKIVELSGTTGASVSQDRQKGFADEIKKHPDMKIIASQTGNFNRAEGQKVMQNIIQSLGQQITAVYAHNDEMAIGAIQAIDAAGKLGEILVGGVDASPDALQEMDKSRLNVTVFQNAKGQGEGGIKAAIALARGETIDQITWVPFELVTPENYKTYMQ